MAAINPNLPAGTYKATFTSSFVLEEQAKICQEMADIAHKHLTQLKINALWLEYLGLKGHDVRAIIQDNKAQTEAKQYYFKWHSDLAEKIKKGEIIL